jgi:hypothetical protein
MHTNIFENKLKEFYLVANEFCKLLENTASLSKHDFISNTQKILTLTYLKASLLEKPVGIEDGEAEKFVRELDWQYIKEQVGAKLALSDKYVILNLLEDVDPENTEEVLLSECFADIYQDLKDFSTNFEIGNNAATIISLLACLDSFEKYWGIRALSILSSIHNLIYGDIELDDEIIDNKSENIDTNNLNTSNWLINKRFNN